jgi:hypothetical protein
MYKSGHPSGLVCPALGLVKVAAGHGFMKLGSPIDGLDLTAGNEVQRLDIWYMYLDESIYANLYDLYA